MELIALLLLTLSIACYSVRELQSHGKLRWMDLLEMKRGFWDDDSYLRKYKLTPESTVIKAPDTWYYRFFKIKYKERFPLSATFLVSITDSYHLLQSLSFLSMAGAIYLFSGINFFIIWGLILLVHFTVYRLLSK